MKSAEQLLTEWQVPHGTEVKCDYKMMVLLIKAAMKTGVENSCEELHAVLDEGVHCPMCGQFAQRYRRRLSSSMACWLISLVGISRNGEYVQARDVFSKMGRRGSAASDYSFLKKWNLTESDSGAQPDDGRTSGAAGFWRPTQQGIDFAHGRVSVYKFAVIYNNVCERFEGNQITIHQAIGSKFNYDELMRAGSATKSLRKNT